MKKILVRFRYTAGPSRLCVVRAKRTGNLIAGGKYCMGYWLIACALSDLSRRACWTDCPSRLPNDRETPPLKLRGACRLSEGALLQYANITYGNVIAVAR